MINLTSDRTKIFKNEKEGRVWWSYSISTKKQDGSYDYMSKTIKFKKEKEPNDSCDIKIKDSFLSFSEVDGKKYDYLMVMDYEILEENVGVEKIYSNEVDLSDDLPF